MKSPYEVELVGTYIRVDTAEWELERYFFAFDKALGEHGLELDIEQSNYELRPYDATTDNKDEEYSPAYPPKDPTAVGDIVVRGRVYARNAVDAVDELKTRYWYAVDEADLCYGPTVTWS